MARTRALSPRSIFRRPDPEGREAAELPIEQPTRFQLILNMKTAKALGITIPQSILVRADRVIE